MNQISTILLGLQLPSKINLQEISDIIFNFNQNLVNQSIGKILKATIHKKIQSDKNILVINIMPCNSPTFDHILQNFTNLKFFKRYIITEIQNLKKDNIPLDTFIEYIEKSKLIFFPINSIPQCIIKAIYQHLYEISGDIIWFNYKPIRIDKGKYYARQLYCELNLDCIKTPDGYKIPSDAIIHVEADNLLPQYHNKQIILAVIEEHENKKVSELLTQNYIIINN
ncbi:MAG: hypothetical protein HPY79_09965 [Bacteroidales bacterium]|nr:hypothetical protein [Bacteroidales bacterium]